MAGDDLFENVVYFGPGKMQTFSMLLANAVKAYRKKHGLSQEEFANLVNTSQTTIVGLEAQRRLPRAETLNAIWDLIRPQIGQTTVARETSPSYAPAEPYLTWLQQLMASDAPYEEKVQSIQESAALELKRLQRRNSA